MVNNADIKIDGITVIAGENDTGKSTISKLVYTLIKSSSKADVLRLYRLYKSKEIKDTLNDMIVSTRQKGEDFFIPNMISEEIIKEFLDIYLDNTYKRTEKQDIIEKIFISYFNREEIIISKSFFKDLKKQVIDLLEEDLDEINICKYKLINYIESVFKGDICNKYTEQETNIVLKESSKELLNIIINDNQLEEYHLNGDLALQDATLIESPIILHMFELIYNAQTILEKQDDFSFMFDRPYVSIHMKDLISKLRQKVQLDFIDESYRPVSKIIKGNMSYNSVENAFFFSKNSKDFNIMNTASGIKAFGILQMLLERGFLSKKNILILDEPEVNIHPKWQIEYARLLVELVEHYGFKILLTSHSPYFIEAIKIYGDKSSIKEDINFYLAEKQERNKTVNIVSVTNSLQKVFDQLTEPLETLEIDDIGDLND